MPDIAKCTNDECTIKHTCYRYTCVPNEYAQWYEDFKPEIDRDGKVTCKKYYQIPKDE